jgi:hypothetical protein
VLEAATALSRHLPGVARETHVNLQLEWAVFLSRFEQDTFRIIAISFSARGNVPGAWVLKKRIVLKNMTSVFFRGFSVFSETEYL